VTRQRCGASSSLTSEYGVVSPEAAVRAGRGAHESARIFTREEGGRRRTGKTRDRWPGCLRRGSTRRHAGPVFARRCWARRHDHGFQPSCGFRSLRLPLPPFRVVRGPFFTIVAARGETPRGSPPPAAEAARPTSPCRKRSAYSPGEGGAWGRIELFDPKSSGWARAKNLVVAGRGETPRGSPSPAAGAASSPRGDRDRWGVAVRVGENATRLAWPGVLSGGIGRSGGRAGVWPRNSFPRFSVV
jgi:hypothetical protein